MGRVREFYEGAVFRPPSEAYSLIVQTTIGCSHNKCRFCTNYREKQFRIKPLEQVYEDFDYARKVIPSIPRVFLADGDALIRKTSDQLAILAYIHKVIPECQRVTSYASPRSILIKTPDELRQIRQAGLTMLYLGLESGSDTVLAHVNKGVNQAQMLEAAQKAHDAGFQLSVTAINGLGGRALWEEHALETGRVLSIMKPEYIGLLTLMLRPAAPMYDEMMRGEFEIPNSDEILREIRLMVASIDDEGCIFRANHVSNYVNLNGTLNKDRDAILKRIDHALNGDIRLKPDRYRIDHL